MQPRIHIAVLSLFTGLLISATTSCQALSATSTAPVARAGVVDFRIAVLPAEIGNNVPAVDPSTPVKVNGTVARWFEIHPIGTENLTRGGYVVSTRNGTSYILCYDDHVHTITHADPQRRPWVINADKPYADPFGGYIVMPFKLDATGGTYMGELTGANKGHPMAILLDDRAISAPIIQSQIGDRGMLTFGSPTPSHPVEAIQKEAEQIKQTIDAANRPATSTQSTPADPEAAVRAVLPKGWAILRVQEDTYPSYRPEGKGKAIFLVSPRHAQSKQEEDAVIHIMPPDYKDGGTDPTRGEAQTWPARLVSSSPKAKIYVWYGGDGWPTIERDIMSALTK